MSQRSSSPCESLFSGYGSAKPVSREKSGGMFGSVPDAFDGKSLKIGEMTPRSRRKQLELARMQELDMDEANKLMQPPAAPNGGNKAAGGEAAAASGAEQQNGGSGATGGNGNGKPNDGAGASEAGAAGSGAIQEKLKEHAANTAGGSSSGGVLIRGGTVVNDDHTFTADVYIVDGVIRSVGNNLETSGDVRTVDATGKYVLPGGIDARTNFSHTTRDGITSVDDYSTGTKAALAGGTTTILNNITPGGDCPSLVEAHSNAQSRADKASYCDYGLYVTLNRYDEETGKQLSALAEKGVNSLVLRLDSPSLDDASAYGALCHARELGMLPQIRAVNGSVAKLKADEVFEAGVTGPEGTLLAYSEEFDVTAAHRAIGLCSAAQCPAYITQISSTQAADVIADARHQGCPVFSETLCSAVAVSGDELFNKSWRHASAYVSTPPLRRDAQERLVTLLETGDIQTVSSDHLTFSADQKAVGAKDFRKIPSGVNGVEDRMRVLWHHGVTQGKITPSQYVACTSSNAAKIFNLYPKKGRIAEGSDGDVIVLDTNATHTIAASAHTQAADYNIYEGLECGCDIHYVIAGGRVVKDTEGLHITEGSGQYLTMACHNEYVYARLNARQKASPQCAVFREPYDGPVTSEPTPTPDHIRSDNPIMPAHPDTFYQRPATSGGARNQQDSSFALSGAQYDEKVNKSCGYRISNPPGGRSSGSLW